ncbi:hypothetical protein [Streptomyces buecherae]|uniref:hypothetical protein n=1 Tax=Streptomyces buecherae TaxID=2763006 RepID=UPI003696F39B
MTTPPCPPGDGPAYTPVHKEAVEATHTRSRELRVSRDFEDPQRQSERHGLRELIAANEELHGPLTAEEIRAAEARMFGDADTQA